MSLHIMQVFPIIILTEKYVCIGKGFFMKRVFLVVLDGVGIGAMRDAWRYDDRGSNTLKAVSKSPRFSMPNMAKLGLFSIDGVDYGPKVENPTGCFARLKERSRGKDTMVGHWEMAGIVTKKPLPVFPQGFPQKLIWKFQLASGKRTICNLPYSGTEVLKDYGEEHMKTGKLIVYTSADSVYQIAAHEDVVPLRELYKYCEIARKVLVGKYGVGRVIARPFRGTAPNFVRTENRKDFALEPPGITMLDELLADRQFVISIGKIVDIFARRGINSQLYTSDNADGIKTLSTVIGEEFEGLCFVNLCDFDTLYGHRNDVDGFAEALSEFDACLPELLSKLWPEDIFMITADHGCDPSTPSTDHSREYVPWIITGPVIKEGVNLGTLSGFSHIGATILDYFDLPIKIKGKSVLDMLRK